MLNSVEVSTQHYLTPFVTGNGSEKSPLFWTLAIIQSWNCCTIAINLAGQPNFAINFQSSSQVTVSNGRQRSFRGPHSVPYFTLEGVAKIVSFIPVFPESTLAFW